MEGITIHIGWEYFVGLMSALIGVAWYANGRFTAIETSIDRIKDMLVDLKKSVDDADAKGRGEASRENAQERQPLKQQTLW